MTGYDVLQSPWKTIDLLTHSFPIHHFSAHENIRKPYAFLMFSGGRENVHLERMG